MTDRGQPDETETRTPTDADRRHAFAELLLSMPDVGEDADFERLRLSNARRWTRQEPYGTGT